MGQRSRADVERYRYRTTPLVSDWRLANVTSIALHTALWIMAHLNGVDEFGHALVDVTVSDVSDAIRQPAELVAAALTWLAGEGVVVFDGTRVVEFDTGAWWGE